MTIQTIISLTTVGVLCVLWTIKYGHRELVVGIVSALFLYWGFLGKIVFS